MEKVSTKENINWFLAIYNLIVILNLHLIVHRYSIYHLKNPHLNKKVINIVKRMIDSKTILLTSHEVMMCHEVWVKTWILLNEKYSVVPGKKAYEHHIHNLLTRSVHEV